MTFFDESRVKTALSNDAAFRISSRFLTGTILLEVGSAQYLLTIENGKFEDFRTVEDVAAADVVFSGSLDSWTKLMSIDRPPGFQAIMYNDGRTGVTLRGTPVTTGALSQVILEMERVLRKEFTGQEDVQLLPEVDREFDSAVGRYVYIRVQGVQYRVYFEEAGYGDIPLLFQHTAGSDGRQARHFLEDPDLQARFRMISYDLPFHGRSLPPTSQRWWESDFKLTREFLFEFVLGLSAKLDLERPAFMGSAIGGLLALDLAYFHPNEFRAVIALNACSAPHFEEEQLDMMATFSDPRIGRQWMSSLMVANMASTSPEISRRELGWVYSQVAPGVAEGALHYYMHSYDLTMEQLATIDTSKIAVYLFTGEDDFLGSESGTDLLAEAMTGVPYQKLRRLGHFGVAENPMALKEDLWSAFQEIAASDSTS